MGKKRKNTNKVRVLPCTDANQHSIEHINKIKKEREYFAKKLAEHRAKMMLEKQQRNAVSSTGETSTIDALENSENI